MKLIECSACGHAVSKAAAACPGCGHPVQRSTWSGAFGFIFVIFLIAVVGAVAIDQQKEASLAHSASKRAAAPPRPPAESDEQREARERKGKDAHKVIEKLQQMDALGEVRVSNHVGKAIVKPQFNLTTFEEKQDFAAAILFWCRGYDPECDVVVFRDVMTNKQVGTFSRSSGLRWE